MNIVDDYYVDASLKELPIEYLILSLRMGINKDLLESEIIFFDIYNKMQNNLIRKMDKILGK